MKSVKPGRGPSGMRAIGAVIAVVFGIFWTIAAASMGAPAMFPLFGILFIIIGIVNAVYHFKNATGENRYSVYDITEEGEETDPLNARFGQQQQTYQSGTSVRFCPYCGRNADSDYEFCPGCGKRLPD
ncbi:MAG: zinc ribbon domain-containing protein [Clostridia bacterium]|nr:zinc ribbon domain-containing protein [Clostridia bacterium]